MRRTASVFGSALLIAVLVQAQGTPPAAPLTLISREGRRPLPTTVVNGQEFIALDDIASLFQVTVREDTLAGGLTVTGRGRSVVVSADRPMASVSGRVITLPAPPLRSGRRWLVPLEFLPRALAPILDTRIDLRRPSRLLLVGDVAVPRVAARIDAAGPPTRATIEITPATPVRVTREGNRIVARIDADALDLAAPVDGAGLIGSIRAGEQPTMVAVSLDERAGAARFAPADAGGVTRIAIEVAAAAPETAAGPAAPAPPEPPAAAPALPALTPARSVLATIVIDPGHGGDDVGVRGPGGTEEKQITLQVARRLRALVAMRLGIRVLLTRDDDRSMSLDDRAAAANNSKAGLFLSLHLNAAPAAAAAGAEVFHLRLDREGEDARRAAATDAAALPVLGGATRTIDVIRWDLAQARHVDHSAALGAILEDALRAAQVAMAPRPRRQAPLRVLTGVNMPAALVEMAYLTNPDQERLARGDEYQNAIAQGLADGILRFRDYLEA
ncbi:MAG: N-acetylmuramoyl-L-alanine amidase, partial [Acidobacteria bacterium]|nr:N-acetylmuramoyl-L-alanine amidase [Acidobacteriota bacterium]